VAWALQNVEGQPSEAEPPIILAQVPPAWHNYSNHLSDENQERQNTPTLSVSRVIDSHYKIITILYDYLKEAS
jgi:hypothetical protein